MHALYIFAKVSFGHDLNDILYNLYGEAPNNVIRSDGNKFFSPIEISVDDSTLIAKLDENGKNLKIEKKPERIWSDAVLLPSRRVGLFITSNFISRLLREVAGEEKEAISFFAGLFKPLQMILEKSPLVPPLSLFIGDYYRTLTGIKEFPKSTIESSLGRVIMKISPLIWLFEYVFRDPFLPNLSKPIESAPEGAIDYMLIRQMVERAERGSLIVIEEPENNKNPLFQIELINFLVSKTLERDLTLLISTHSEIIPLTLAKLVEEKIISNEDVRIYYLHRDKENPWTKVKEIKIYKDGSMDELPDSIEVTIRLF